METKEQASQTLRSVFKQHNTSAADTSLASNDRSPNVSLQHDLLNHHSNVPHGHKKQHTKVRGGSRNDASTTEAQAPLPASNAGNDHVNNRHLNTDNNNNNNFVKNNESRIEVVSNNNVKLVNDNKHNKKANINISKNIDNKRSNSNNINTNFNNIDINNNNNNNNIKINTKNNINSNYNNKNNSNNTPSNVTVPTEVASKVTKNTSRALQGLWSEGSYMAVEDTVVVREGSRRKRSDRGNEYSAEREMVGQRLVRNSDGRPCEYGRGEVMVSKEGVEQTTGNRKVSVENKKTENNKEEEEDDEDDDELEVGLRGKQKSEKINPKNNRIFVLPQGSSVLSELNEKLKQTQKAQKTSDDQCSPGAGRNNSSLPQQHHIKPQQTFPNRPFSQLIGDKPTFKPYVPERNGKPVRKHNLPSDANVPASQRTAGEAPVKTEVQRPKALKLQSQQRFLQQSKENRDNLKQASDFQQHLQNFPLHARAMSSPIRNAEDDNLPPNNNHLGASSHSGHQLNNTYSNANAFQFKKDNNDVRFYKNNTEITRNKFSNKNANLQNGLNNRLKSKSTHNITGSRMFIANSCLL